MTKELIESLELNLGDWAIVTDAIALIKSLTTELETERIRLAACGVVAMCNTPETAANQRQMKDEYKSASLSDVCSAVDREMALRTKCEALQAQVVELETKLVDTQLKLNGVVQIGNGLVDELAALRAQHIGLEYAEAVIRSSGVTP